MNKVIETKHGKIETPAFMPDATYGSIKTISFNDAKHCKVSEIVTTTLHLEQKLGSNFIKQNGGIHKFIGWDRPILSDSGGWQVYSLINSKKSKRNFITEAGCSFIDNNTGKQTFLSPENSIEIQANIGADILTALDNPIGATESLKARKDSIKLNTIWAKRAMKSFKKLSGEFKIGGVIQGAGDFELRKISALELLNLNFDLYNFGGIPMYYGESWKSDKEHRLYYEMLEYVSNLIPENKIKYAMGVGQPKDIAFCVDYGWDLFDTVLPTRNARHGYLYVSESLGENTETFLGNKNLNKLKLSYDIVRIKSQRYQNDGRPVDQNCNCECCTTVSRNYLRHLIKINEPAGFRLATIHNLTFFSNWLNLLRINLKILSQ